MDIANEIIIALITLNLVVSIKIGLRDDLEAIQKFIQIFIIWIIPLVAAIGLWVFHRSNDNPRSNKGPIGGGSGGGPVE